MGPQTTVWWSEAVVPLRLGAHLEQIRLTSRLTRSVPSLSFQA